MARKKKCKVFVSYSRHDEALVRPLAGLLGVAADDAVFLDVTSLKPGERWETEIFDALKQAKVFVLCWCCQSEKSRNVAKEIAAALAEGNKRLVPVLFCGMPLPPELAERQWTDLRGKVVHECPVPHMKATEFFAGRKKTNLNASAYDDTPASAPMPTLRTSRKAANFALVVAAAFILIIGLLITSRVGIYEDSNPMPTTTNDSAPRTMKPKPDPTPANPDQESVEPEPDSPPERPEKGTPEITHGARSSNFSAVAFIPEMIAFVVLPALFIAFIIRYSIAQFIRRVWRPVQDRDQAYVDDIEAKAKSYFEGLAAK